MADKTGKDEDQFAWDADVNGPKKTPGDPSESGTTYRLSNPAPSRPAAAPGARVTVIEPVPPRRVASRDRASWLALMGYNLLVFLTSACVMTLELTASRIIAKHLGASLYTWTSVIGVILAGITLGNWLGGWLADRYDKNRALGWMYLLASIFSASVLFLEQLINDLDRPASINWQMWVLAVVALLFLLPALALGATSPLIASLAVSRSHKLGSTVGNVYAWGAGGSIVGTFLTGFFLFAVLGSRSIIGLVSATLAVLAVVMASQRSVFRAVVLCGWVQLFLFSWIAASATQVGYANAGLYAADWTRWLRSDNEATRSHWHHYGGNIGQKLHELGLALGLRDDYPGRYQDESQYSFIQISEGRQDGAPVKVLRLDKLIHSYYNPADPTALHYDYEKIYAAVTVVAASFLKQQLSIPVADFPGWAEIRSQLPSDVHFDEATKRLTAGRMDGRLVDQLLELTPDADYWFAVDQLSIITTQPGWGGLEAHALDRLPDGVAIPADLAPIIRFDDKLRLLNAYQPITPEIRDLNLIQLSPRGPWFTAVNDLRKQSGKFSSFFIGGGGYIFPRWLAEEFPGTTRINVAELDPAVRLAVISELGLTPEDEMKIVTKDGDARHVVDDLLRKNRQREKRQEPPVTYDFIFGDAFNDFSVPWHLTTLEFQQKLRKLMSPRGVLQVNLIDVLPRSEYPGRPAAVAEVRLRNFVPKGLVKGENYPPNQFIPLLSKFGAIEINCVAAADFQLRATQVLSEHQRKMLLNLDRANADWAKAVNELVSATRQSEPYAGEIPAALIPKQLTPHAWVSATSSAPSMELQQTESGKFVLGYRGVMTDAAKASLLELAPQDAGWREAVTALQQKSLREAGGQFLGRFVYTASLVFPNIYLFSTTSNPVSVSRDTFVIVCSQEPLNLQRLDLTGYWSGKPFAVLESKGTDAAVEHSGQMESVLAMARQQALTDDFAPVENLLLPIFAGQ